MNHAETVMLFVPYLEHLIDQTDEELFDALVREATDLFADEWAWDRFIALGNRLADAGSLSRDQFLESIA